MIKPYEPKILGEKESEKKHDIREIDHSASMVVGEYQAREIAALTRDPRLSAHMGAFKLNSLQRATLGIDEEERQRLEAEIQRRVDEALTQLKAQAFEEGKKAGLENGRQEALQSFEKEKNEITQKLSTVIHAFETASMDIFKHNERFLIHLCAQIAKTVALKEIAVDEHYLSRLFQSVIEKVGIRDHIKMKINPRDEKTALSMKKETEARMSDLRNLTIEATEDVVDGGCIVETDWNSVDARVETQIKQILQALTDRGNDGAQT